MQTSIFISAHGGAYEAVAALLATPLPIPVDAPPRVALAAEIERLITILDVLDGDPDLELNGDLEPSLGAYSCGDAYDGEADPSEQEHSLGSLDGQANQENWSGGINGDYEMQHDDEPDLGWSTHGALVDGRGLINEDGTVKVIEERVPTRRVRRAADRVPA